MTRKTRELLPTTPLSVTVPHTLYLDDQVMSKTTEREKNMQNVSNLCKPDPTSRRRVRSPTWVLQSLRGFIQLARSNEAASKEPGRGGGGRGGESASESRGRRSCGHERH